MRTALLAAALPCSIAGFYLGGIVGYAEAEGTQLGIRALGHGAETVAVLRALRREDTASAIHLLESSLDADILSHGVSEALPPSRFQRKAGEAPSPCLVNVVVEYRASHPSENSSPEIRDNISKTLRWLGRRNESSSAARRPTSECS